MKRNKKTILILVVILLAVVGAAFYILANKKHDQASSAKNECRTMNNNTYCSNDYINLTEAEAKAKADASDIPNRVVKRDGISQAINFDNFTYRLNFTIAKDRVIKVEFY